MKIQLANVGLNKTRNSEIFLPFQTLRMLSSTKQVPLKQGFKCYLKTQQQNAEIKLTHILILPLWLF